MVGSPCSRVVSIRVDRFGFVTCGESRAEHNPFGQFPDNRLFGLELGDPTNGLLHEGWFWREIARESLDGDPEERAAIPEWDGEGRTA